MVKHSTKSKSTQDLHVAHTAHVELPMLSALEDIDRAFFGICIEAGKQVLDASIRLVIQALLPQNLELDVLSPR